jgi:hypothetical protein
MKQHIAIIPDDRYPHMWRIRFADGSLSDRLNHQRAAEVAYAYRRRGVPLGTHTGVVKSRTGISDRTDPFPPTGSQGKSAQEHTGARRTLRDP